MAGFEKEQSVGWRIMEMKMEFCDRKFVFSSNENKCRLSNVTWDYQKNSFELTKIQNEQDTLAWSSVV